MSATKKAGPIRIPTLPPIGLIAKPVLVRDARSDENAGKWHIAQLAAVSHAVVRCGATDSSTVCTMPSLRTGGYRSVDDPPPPEDRCRSCWGLE